MKAHILGFPRIGAERETKHALESYWKGELSEEGLLAHGVQQRLHNWSLQHEAGLDFVSVGDFSFYDHVLDTSALLGVIPKRFNSTEEKVSLDTYFRMARGRGAQSSCCASNQADTFACEMTKWFDTNYHYLVPEIEAEQTFHIASDKLFDEVAEAQAAGFNPKPVLLGPLSFLHLAKCKGGEFDRLALLPALLNVYKDILTRLLDLGVEWVQVDEPILVLDLDSQWRQAFEMAYNQLQATPIKKLLSTYFGGLGGNAQLAVNLPVQGLHLDAVRAPEQLAGVLDKLPPYKILSLGVVDGRNVWANELSASLNILQQAKEQLGERLWVASSCSLLHSPVDLQKEQQLDDEMKSWLSFAVQKLDEIAVLKTALNQGADAVHDKLSKNASALQLRRESARIHNADVKQAVENISPEHSQRSSVYAGRAVQQQQRFKLPLLPTTTIGSFPQTKEIRTARRQFKKSELDAVSYAKKMRAEIAFAVQQQEQYGLDVLVHGEAERNDMVEYFGELLEGFAFTENGWVQSYGSRCVKPPIIFGDVSRPQAMTVQWTQYAQSLSAKPMKGMLTGPVTILQWSFVRDDQPREITCKQIALALREEVADLEQAGIGIIQIDEPALREGLPLRQSDWKAYLAWAVESFRISAAVVDDATQVHTHMCYAEFNDIIQSIADLDADVITIETSRSDMDLLDAFANFDYPNEVGPGVYDIHSPRVPTVEEMVALINKAAELLPIERLWVNPDCGLKTRGWPETEAALVAMVEACRQLRERYADSPAAA